MTDINEIANTINLNGGKLYLVGGALRDEILGIKNHDEDYSVTGISFDEFKKLFPMAYVRGKDFPVFSINNKEFAIARKERKIGIGHKDFDVETDKKITIEQDLERRDITINAIAKEVLTGKIIDPFGGIEDLKSKKIRAVSSHFEEDPLRVYRVARFASQFDFKVEENTIKMMTSLKSELTSLSVERVYNEFSKALLKCGVTSCLEHMRGGIFDKMTTTKKVKFIERVNSTILGLDGLQIIVDADDMTSEKNNSNQFAKLGHEVINCTNGNEIMKKYGITEGKEVANKMHEVRVKYLKKL